MSRSIANLSSPTLRDVPPLEARIYRTTTNMEPPKSTYRPSKLTDSHRRRYCRSIGVERDGNVYTLVCTYCGAEGGIRWDLANNKVYMVDDMELDHIIPKRLGGTHDPENLTPACRPCNNKKGITVDRAQVRRVLRALERKP